MENFKGKFKLSALNVVNDRALLEIREMNTDAVKVPVEYIITTTSDWTMFEIVEGGRWQDLNVVCKEGKDRLTREITFDNKSIRIDKRGEDEQPVVVSAKCVLNIQKEYRYSNLKYKITKGDMQSTVVMTTIKGKKSFFMVNKGYVSGDPCNPCTYTSPVHDYLPDLKKDKVFIVHGREEYPALLLHKYLHNLGVDAITFDDFPDKGKTIIEQIEYIRDNISYAFAVLTPDDVGCRQEEADEISAVVAGIKKVTKEAAGKALQALQGRARQNVIFELGLFIGALGRENVCCLKQKDVKELPSDLSGILYKEFDKDVKEIFHELREELFGTE